ncbi:MAG: hypothetical protein JWN78_2640 [Bacteroidota bacterium]|nr:hypothetical protein [Bacteroidota bacterium]
MKKLFFFIIAGLLLLNACKKSTTSSPSTKDMLTAKTWKATALSDKGVASTEWCWMNNLYTYSNSGFVFEEKKENIIGCSGDPAGTIYKSYWNLSPDNKWIITQDNLSIPPDEADSFKIISIDASTLKTERYVNKGYSYASTWAETFTAQ